MINFYYYKPEAESYSKLINKYLTDPLGFCDCSTKNITKTSDKTENSKDTIIEVELPGFEKDEISIEVWKGLLIVEATAPNRKAVKREWTLSNIDIEKITSTLKNGILIITLPPKTITSKKINIT